MADEEGGKRRSMIPWYAAVAALVVVVGILTALLVSQSDYAATGDAPTVTVTAPQQAAATVAPTVTKTVTETSTQVSTARPTGSLPEYTQFPAEPFPAQAGTAWVRKGPYTGASNCNLARNQWQGMTSECFNYRGSSYFYGLQQTAAGR